METHHVEQEKLYPRDDGNGGGGCGWLACHKVIRAEREAVPFAKERGRVLLGMALIVAAINAPDTVVFMPGGLYRLLKKCKYPRRGKRAAHRRRAA
jgi:hypothetical protein